MSKAQHTPGPWAYEPDITRIYSVPTNMLIASIAIAGNPACDAAWPADAHLIAAAPDLLAALKQIIENDDFKEHRPAGYAKAVYTIRKAEGCA